MPALPTWAVPRGRGRAVPGFENFDKTADELEHRLQSLGVALGIDWGDAAALKLLAEEALEGGPTHLQALLRGSDPRERAKGELFGLTVLMLKLMQGSASIGVLTHGGVAWKAFGRALIEAAGQARPS